MKPQAEIDAKKNINSCNGSLFSNHSVTERVHIFSLKNYGEALKQKCCFSGALMMAIIHLHFLVSARWPCCAIYQLYYYYY